jgi:transcriptional regulator with XRE-family HTH domain
LGISQRELAARARVALTTVQDIQLGKRARLQAGTKTRLEDALEWATGSIDHVMNGGDPTLRPRSSSSSVLPLSPLLEEILIASHAQLAEVADLISTTAGSPTEGDQWLQAVLRLRRPRDDVEIRMQAVDDDPRVIWSLIWDRRERLRDEAPKGSPRMGQSG